MERNNNTPQNQPKNYETPTHHQITLKMFKKKGVLFLREEYGEGFGKYTFPDGQKYVGRWKDDKRNGQGHSLSLMEGSM